MLSQVFYGYALSLHCHFNTGFSIVSVTIVKVLLMMSESEPRSLHVDFSELSGGFTSITTSVIDGNVIQFLN